MSLVSPPVNTTTAEPFLHCVTPADAPAVLLHLVEIRLVFVLPRKTGEFRVHRDAAAAASFCSPADGSWSVVWRDEFDGDALDAECACTVSGDHGGIISTGESPRQR